MDKVKSLPVWRSLSAVGMLILLCSACEMRKPEPLPKRELEPVLTEKVMPVEAVPAPPVARYLRGGEGAFNLAAWLGRVVILDFCAPWSAASQSRVEALDRLYQEWEPSGLSVIGMVVETGPAEDNSGWGGSYPLVDTPRSALSLFGNVRAIPTRFIYDRKGQLRFQYPGDVPVDRLRGDVRTLLDES